MVEARGIEPLSEDHTIQAFKGCSHSFDVTQDRPYELSVDRMFF